MRAESKQDLLSRLITVIAFVGASLIAACGVEGDGRAPNEPGTPAPTTGPDAAEVYFAKRRPGLDGGPTALLSGKLVLDDRGCLRVRLGADGPTWVPVWPAGYELKPEEGSIRVEGRLGLEGRGRGTVAEVGKKVTMGGGEVGLQKDIVGPRTVRELRERCPGEYWFVLDSSVGPPSKPAPIPGPEVNGGRSS